jgi:hypothetical protein
MASNIWFYADDKGLHFYWVKKVNNVLYKQELKVENMIVETRALYIWLAESGLVRVTSWGELKTLPDRKFF